MAIAIAQLSDPHLLTWHESVIMGQNHANRSDCVNKGNNKDETPSTTVVFKVDMHCDGCASKFVKCVRAFQALKLNRLVEAVETWKTEIDTGKLTVIGNVDSTKPRDKLADKTKKNSQLISPHSNKDKKPKDKQTPEKTVVLKVSRYCRCQGCFSRLRKAVLKVEGVCDDVAIDSKDEWWMVTAKCTMDVNIVAGTLSKKLKRVVEVVPPKKEKEKEKEKEKKREGEKEGDKGGNSAAAKKKKKGGGGGGGGGGEDNGGGDKGKTDQEESIMYYGLPTSDYANAGYGDVNYMGQYNHVSQMFSEENPYACHIM